MPRNPTTGIFDRVSNSFSDPIVNTVIDPGDAIALFDDYDSGLTFDDTDPLILVGSTSGVTTVVAEDAASGTLTLPAATDTLVGKATTDILTNKSVNLANNTLTGTTAQFNAALSDGNFATEAGAETLTNKTIALGSNTISGTIAQFNIALTDADFATLAGAETLSNKTVVSPVITGTADLQQAIAFTGDITPAQITANQNDYAPTGFATTSTLRLSSDASRNVTGLAGGTDGRIIIVQNVGTQNIVLTNQDASSAAGNRFLFGADVELLPNYSITLRYDATTQRWRAITTATASGGAIAAADVTYTAPGTGAVASNVAARLDNEINLIDFWTNSADDSADFQAALDYAATLPNGGTVFFGKNPASSHWRITNPIYVRSTATQARVHLRGSGKGTTLILDVNGMVVIGGDTTNLTRHSGISDFTISITGGGTWLASQTVILQNTSRCFVRNIDWFGWSRIAIRNGLTTPANSTASGTQFSGLVGVAADAQATHAISFGSVANSGDFNIDNINFNGGGAGSGGALFNFVGTGAAQVDGLNASNFLGTNFDYGILADVQSTGGMYTHSYVNGTFDTGLTTNGNVFIVQSGGTVQNLIFNGVNFASSTAVAGRNLSLSNSGGTIETVSITGCNMYDSGGDGILIAQGGAGVIRGITISGNVIRDGSRTATNTFDAIYVEGNVSGLSITGNSIYNPSTNWRYGINVENMNSANTPNIMNNNIGNVGTTAVRLNTNQQRLSAITGNTGTVTSAAASGGNPQLIQAWVVYNSSTSTIVDSYNVTSIAKNATGDVTVNLANAVAGSSVGVAGSGTDVQVYTAALPGSGAARLRSATVGTATLIDTTVSAVFFGRRGN